MTLVSTILIIEDEPQLLADMGQIFTLEGYIPILASTGEQALAYGAEQMPDLIMCDLNLPDMTGYEVLAQLRQRPATAQTPVVFISGDLCGAPVVEDRAPILPKPFTIETLLSVVETAI